MKKNLLGKTVKLAILLSIASMVGIEAGQAYKLYCPTPDTISMKSVKKQYEYSAIMGRDQDMVSGEDIADMDGKKEVTNKEITLHALHNTNLNLSSFSFQAASSSSNNHLSCLYGDQNTQEILTLTAALKKGTQCTVIYPDGHEHPNLSYFECNT